ncbi:MAG: hypothetical protein HKP30_01265 [Myxococcales bacterium]|nr:hypothetical protein [Myxococcales bacterium]
MREWRGAWIALVAALVSLAPAQAGAGRVVLVGIDGASWRVIDGMVAEGALPAFADLARRGVSAELATVEPVVSPVVWTSLATGRMPADHGVGGFLATRMALRTPTVFDRLAGAGLRVGLFEYLVSWPPPAYPDGFVAPGWMRRDPSLWPPDLFARAGLAPWRFDHPRPAFSREATVAEIRDELARKPAIFTKLLSTYRPDVAAVTFYAVDRASHRFWRDAYPGDFAGNVTASGPREGSFLREVMTGVDAALAKLVAQLAPEDTLLIASDHGFQADPERDDAIMIGRTADHFAAADLDPARDGFSLVREWGVIVVRVHPGPFEARDAVHERLVRFYQGITTSAGESLVTVHRLDDAERPAAARRSLFERLRQWGLRQYARRFFGAKFDEPAHGWVIARFDADRMAALGSDARVRVAGKPVRAGDLAFAERFDGTHHPTAVFLAAGGPIRALPERQALSVLDVAPLLLHLAGQPLPDDLAGTLPREWLRPEHLAAHPPRGVPAAQAPRFESTGASPEVRVGDDAMVDRLRALGYVR